MIIIDDDDEKNIEIMMDVAEVPKYPLLGGRAHRFANRLKVALLYLKELRDTNTLLYDTISRLEKEKSGP
jgi:hypothetical protein